MRKLTLATAAGLLTACVGTAQADFINTILTSDAQGGEGDKGVLFRPVTTGGLPADFVMTARARVDKDDPFNLSAPGDEGVTYILDQGAGVKHAIEGGSKEISGGGPNQNEDLNFLPDTNFLAGSVQLGLAKFDAGDGLGDKDDTVIFIVLDDGTELVLTELDYMDAFVATGMDSGFIDFGQLSQLDGDELITQITVRETKSHVVVFNLLYRIPAPGVLGLLALTGLAAGRRRRR